MSKQDLKRHRPIQPSERRGLAKPARQAGPRPPGRSLAVAMLMLGLGLGGCSALTTYREPELPMPSAFVEADAQSQEAAARADAAAAQGLTPWWLELHDPQLDALIQQVLAQNISLAQAALKVRQAQLTAQQAGVNELPAVTASVDTSMTQPLKGGTVTKSSNLSLGVSWEVDLWGRLRALSNAAEFEAKATTQDREAVAQALVATTASLYFELGYLNERIALSEQTIRYGQRSVELVRAQRESGTASGLDVAQAEQSLAEDQANHRQYLLQRVQTRNALALLFDRTADAPVQEAQHLPAVAPPEVPAGLPARVLRRRPDLKAAELRLRESLAEVDATRTSYYPDLSLTASAGGVSSTALGNVLDHPVRTLGAGLALPFLQWGDMQRAVAISQAQYESAVLGYRQSWYNALSDVYNALGARAQYGEQVDRLGVALNKAELAERLTRAQYQAGTVPLQNVLNAEESRRQAQASLILARYSLYSAVVTLYQVLGGDVSSPARAHSGQG